MKIKNINTVHKIVDLIIENNIEKNSICVDATLGNGFDSLKMAKKLDDTGKLYCFDIQEIAIENSKKLFLENDISVNNIEFINDNHVNILNYISENVDFFIMNLGYLPNGDKSITTHYKDVICFIKNIFKIMVKGSTGVVVFYPGHTEGLEEYIKVREYLKNISQKEFNVIDINLLNQKNNPPALTYIERLR